MAPPPAYARFVAAVFDGDVPAPFLSSEGFAKARNGAWSPFVDAELVAPTALAEQLGEGHVALPSLRAFLRRGQGGFYALWRPDGRGWRECPVVFVGGKVGGGAVVGRSLDEFLGVAAWGVDPFTLSAQRSQPKVTKPAAFFTRRRIAAIPDPVGVLAAAAAEFSGFAVALSAPAAASVDAPAIEAAEPVAQPSKKKGANKKKAAPVAAAAAASEPSPALPPPPPVAELDAEAETEELPRAVAPPRAPSAAEMEAAEVTRSKPASAPNGASATAPSPAPPAAPRGAPPEGPPPGSTEAQKKAWWKIW